MTNERKHYLRFIYRRTFRYLGAALVISLLAGTLLGGGVYIVNALCAFGCVMICWGWFTYLRMTGMRPFGKGEKKKAKVPYVHQRYKQQKPHRPSFDMDSNDFDDDLVSQTAVSEEAFTRRQQDAAAAIARAVCGALMVILSFFIPT